MDSRIRSALQMKDTCTYTPVSGPAVAGCTVLVDRGLTTQTLTGDFVTNETRVTLFREQIGETLPAHGATVTLDGTSEVLTIDSIAQRDESRVICTVKA